MAKKAEENESSVMFADYEVWRDLPNLFHVDMYSHFNLNAWFREAKTGSWFLIDKDDGLPKLNGSRVRIPWEKHANKIIRHSPRLPRQDVDKFTAFNPTVQMVLKKVCFVLI